MKSMNKMISRLCWLAIFLLGSLWGSTCQIRAPGLHVDVEDDDELYIDFPGGYIDFGPGGPVVNVPPFEMEIEDD